MYDLIEKLPDKESACGATNAQAIQALILRQEISEMILTTSLQVDGFLTETDTEIGQIRAVHDDLADQRDKAVGLSSLGGAAGTGGGAVASALALGAATVATAGNWVGLASGGFGALFGFLGLVQQKGSTECFPDLRGSTQKEKKGGKKEKKDQCSKLDAEPALSCSATSLSQYKPDNDPCKTDPKTPSNSKSKPRGCSPRMLYALICSKEAEDADIEVQKLANKARDGWAKAEKARNAENLEAAKKLEDTADADASTAKVFATKWRNWWFHSMYDPAISEYLKSVPPTPQSVPPTPQSVPPTPQSVPPTPQTENESRRDTLIKTWRTKEDADNTKQKFPEYLQTDAKLFSGNADSRKLSIDDLDERANKLSDLRTLVARMNRDLSRLTEDLANGLRCQLP